MQNSDTRLDSKLPNREKRMRRAARARGYRLVKSRSRDPKSPSFGCYVVIDAERDAVVLGAEPHAFSASLDQVESFLMDGSRTRDRERPLESAEEEPEPAGTAETR